MQIPRKLIVIAATALVVVLSVVGLSACTPEPPPRMFLTFVGGELTVASPDARAARSCSEYLGVEYPTTYTVSNARSANVWVYVAAGRPAVAVDVTSDWSCPA